MSQKWEMNGCGDLFICDDLFWWQRYSVGHPQTYRQTRIHASVSWSFFWPRKAYILHLFYGKYFVWHCATCPEEQCQLFTIYIIIGYYFVDFQHYLSAYFSVRLSWLCSYYKMAMALCCIANMFD